MWKELHAYKQRDDRETVCIRLTADGNTLMAVRPWKTDKNPMAMGMQRTDVSPMAVGAEFTGSDLGNRTARSHQ